MKKETEERYVFFVLLRNPNGGLSIDNLECEYDREYLMELAEKGVKYRLERVNDCSGIADVYITRNKSSSELSES